MNNKVTTDDVVGVVLHFRTPEKSLACLQSLVDESVHRVVLVDNSEDDGASLQGMRDGLEALREQGAEIQLLSENRNLGFAAGVNKALAAICSAGAPDVLLLNSDARLCPGAVAELVQAVRAGASIAAPVLISPAGEALSSGVFYNQYFAVLSLRQRPGSLCFLSGACQMISRDWVRPKLYDEDFFFYGEDVALAAELHRQNRRQVVVQSSRVWHEGSGSAKRGSLFYEYHINRGHWLLASKLLATGPGFMLALACRGVTLPARALIRAIRFRSWVPLMGFCLALTDLVLSRRRSMTPPASSA